MKVEFFNPVIETKPYCWMFKIGDCKVGVHQCDGWCMKQANQIILIDSETKCTPLLPVLELGKDTFFDFLTRAKETYPTYAKSIDRFPKTMLLKHVFHTSFSAYWPEKAFGWLQADPLTMRHFLEELEKFVSNKVMPQGSRQKARKMFYSLKPQNPTGKLSANRLIGQKIAS